MPLEVGRGNRVNTGKTRQGTPEWRKAKIERRMGELRRASGGQFSQRAPGEILASFWASSRRIEGIFSKSADLSRNRLAPSDRHSSQYSAYVKFVQIRTKRSGCS